MNNLERVRSPTYGVDWIQNLRGDTLDSSRDLETEHLGLLVLCVQEAARVDGIDDLPCVGQLNAAA